MNIFSQTFWLKSPNIEYCEKAIQGIIARPWYAISNLPFILIGLIIILQNRKSRFSILFGLFSILIGVFSFLYDASYTFLSQYFDWLGMFLFILFLNLINLKRVFDLSNSNLGLIGIVILLPYLVISLLVSDGVVFFGLGIITLIISEVYLAMKNRRSIIGLWIVALILYALGAYLRGLDAQGIVCDPTNILNGRGLLHYLSSISIILLHSYYKRVLAIK